MAGIGDCTDGKDSGETTDDNTDNTEVDWMVDIGGDDDGTMTVQKLVQKCKPLFHSPVPKISLIYELLNEQGIRY